MTILRGILRPEAERRAQKWVGPRIPVDLVAHHLRVLCDDLDASARALAVALGLWSEPWPDGLAAPELMLSESGWMLVCAGGAFRFYDGKRFRGLDAFTEQSQAMDAVRCIWTALEGK